MINPRWKPRRTNPEIPVRPESRRINLKDINPPPEFRRTDLEPVILREVRWINSKIPACRKDR